MRKLHNDVHGFTGVMMPYKLLERYPELLRIDRRLSVSFGFRRTGMARVDGKMRYIILMSVIISLALLTTAIFLRYMY